MEWSAATLWWIAAGVLIAAEMATGTFYLLMLALGVTAAALSAHLGLAFSAQLVAAALVGGGAIVAWHVRRQRQQALAGAVPNRNFNLDVGEQVSVERWEPDGTARIDYRGAQWNARYADEGEPQPGLHTIRGIESNRLLLGR
ncbi:NfeD family protein [Methylibium sp.]|uniref:NfeD family protein n=1 Tax=Methylibium sp. TaxID=2067992 RepID=UPI00183E1CA3|nr:NfeD family protein [Methylibium sp.]MBA3591403.1 NfeD family protein [Methylibium sp.]